ncbi:MAG: RIP metalloprotease RseP [Gammaproteobacteria bacterium]|nr:RIP metalloprotease RseP [Gammaproteobacteria bacterium]MBT5116492.1 RIP metalloprotease RseP [Gammaproteobacteria bacterium]MBT5761521.1 RIP metalloprotease RseP [Gammaproteobacteria bacterium]MBT6331416.1 RIP metalloprotease RseP [Gammaproteobacteria bacterium]MBT7323166.1 RIP metalloprotease RseP [Gammaproteobacteria bacterium]
MEIIQSILGFFIAIGILVTFHEFGHFYIARLFNVRVLNFSIGFGKTLYKKKFSSDGTEYSIGLIPLGGYVKMLESSEINDDTDKSDYLYCFDKQSVYKKFLIVAAGPAFNLILAIIFFTIIHFSGITGMKPFITSIDGHNLPTIETNSFHEIIEVNGIVTKRWQDVRVEILNTVVNKDKLDVLIRDSKNDTTSIKINYEDNILKKDGDIITNIGLKPKTPEFPSIVGSIENNSPASLAGLQVGDQIISVNKVSITNWNALVEQIKINPDKILQLKLIRDDKELDIILVPAVNTSMDNNYGYAGISPDQTALNKFRILVKYPFFESIYKSILLTYDYSLLTIRMIYELFTGQANMKNISGPLSIAEFSGKSLSMGFVYFAYLLAILSISLGVLNLLPIPVLDGGHLVYYILEMLTGKPVSEKVQLIAQQFGMLILFGIMIIAFYNDFARLLQ